MGLAILQGDSKTALQCIRSGEPVPWLTNDCSILTFSIKKRLDNKLIQELISRAGPTIINHLDPEPDSDTALAAATRVLKSNVVSQLLKHNADPNLSNALAYKPLYLAVYFEGRSVKMRGSINRCALKTQTSTQDRTYDVYHRSLPIIRTLINYRASVNAEDADGETALQSYVNQYCVDLVDPKMVRLLVAFGANPKDSIRKNPLSDKNYKALSKDFILIPANPNKTEDWTARLCESSRESPMIPEASTLPGKQILRFPENNQVKQASTAQRSAMGWAIQKSNTKTALELIRSGKPFPWIEHDYSTLTSAIKKELGLELIQALILRADPKIINHICPQGDTALMAASRLLSSDVVLQLLQNNADPNLCNTLGYTPLYLTVCFGDKAIPVKGPPNRYQPEGRIPPFVRMHMIFQRSLPIIKTLIENRAFVDAKDIFEKTPLQAYVNQPRVGRIDSKMVTLLVALGANPLNGIRLKFHSEFSPRIDGAIREGLAIKNLRSAK